MAYALKKNGLNSGEIVGLCLEPGIDQIIALLAVLKCGAVYMPINPELPLERIKYMLND